MTNRSEVLKAAATNRIAAARRLLAVPKPSLDQLTDAATNLLTATRQQGEVIAIAESEPPITTPPIGTLPIGPIPDYPASDKRLSTAVFNAGGVGWSTKWIAARFGGQTASADQYLDAATPEEERALAGAGTFGTPIRVGVSTGQPIDWSNYTAFFEDDGRAYAYLHGEKIGELDEAGVNGLPAGNQRVSDWAKSLGLDIGV